MNSKSLYGKYFHVLIIGVITLVFMSSAFAGNNRKNVMDTRENGWAVAWGKHINHIEYAKLSICMLDPTTVCINAYFTGLIKDSAKTLGKNIVLKALKNRGKLFSSGNIEFGAGIATYNHWGRENPCSVTGGTCWTPKIPGPNTHQPFVRWRTKSSAANQTIPAGNFKFDNRAPIYYSNGQGHYCWFNSWEKFTQLTDGKWRTQRGRLSKYKMKYDGICTGGSSSPAGHPDPNF